MLGEEQSVFFKGVALSLTSSNVVSINGHKDRQIGKRGRILECWKNSTMLIMSVSVNYKNL